MTTTNWELKTPEVTNLTNIEITWQAFGNKHIPNKQSLLVTSADLKMYWTPVDTEQTRLELCEEIYAATNLQSGKIWENIKPLLSVERTHTSLSVGDKIVIGYVHVYIVAEIGFVKIAGMVD